MASTTADVIIANAAAAYGGGGGGGGGGRRGGGGGAATRLAHASAAAAAVSCGRQKPAAGKEGRGGGGGGLKRGKVGGANCTAGAAGGGELPWRRAMMMTVMTRVPTATRRGYLNESGHASGRERGSLLSSFCWSVSSASIDGLRGERHVSSSASGTHCPRWEGGRYFVQRRRPGRGGGGRGRRPGGAAIRRGSGNPDPNPHTVGGLSVRGYIEREKGFGDLVNRARGALPVIGLLSRILTAEGGVGADQLRFPEFATRVSANSSWKLTQALYDLRTIHGERAKVNHVLLWCWVAAIGGGLVLSDDILLGAARLRVSNDLEYEIDNFDLLMDEGAKRRAKSKAKAAKLPLEARAAVALEAISKSCLGDDGMNERDMELLDVVLGEVFPTVDKAVIKRMLTAQMAEEEQVRRNKHRMEEEKKSGKEESEMAGGSSGVSAAAASTG
ncbi:hypothetical protein CBR_g163 [Chara braunii]|uniref:Uncharacterized protein n=1 Tax=Chara braunii TaxID=69332 RepID=A0A388JLY6_CHABU|nr:hypothetical protein CBR_g163 [Chara braunii]|eukprot:GBG58763.1 hypothetical protein CBR_g163 [Chara braunii]